MKSTFGFNYRQKWLNNGAFSCRVALFEFLEFFVTYVLQSNGPSRTSSVKVRGWFQRQKAGVSDDLSAAPGSGSGSVSVQRHDSVRALKFWIQEIQPHHPAGSKSSISKRSTATFIKQKKNQRASCWSSTSTRKAHHTQVRVYHPFPSGAQWLPSDDAAVREDEPSGAYDCPEFLKRSDWDSLPLLSLTTATDF